MSEIEVIEGPGLDGKRRALVLTEDRIGHYPEFREFFTRRFSLDTNGLSKSGYIRGPSGMIYSLVFVGRSGEPFPDGLEVYALVDALEPLSEEDVDTDLWAFLRWMIQGLGGEWKVEDLDATGRLYQLPFLSRQAKLISGCWFILSHGRCSARTTPDGARRAPIGLRTPCLSQRRHTAHRQRSG
jgi:hypothetical protein